MSKVAWSVKWGYCWQTWTYHNRDKDSPFSLFELLPSEEQLVQPETIFLSTWLPHTLLTEEWKVILSVQFTPRTEVHTRTSTCTRRTFITLVDKFYSSKMLLRDRLFFHKCCGGEGTVVLFAKEKKVIYYFCLIIISCYQCCHYSKSVHKWRIE